jgi:SAM-dependent methyltransferase
MRLAHSYVDAADARAGQVTLPSGAAEHATHMSYAHQSGATREAFLAAADERWVVELRAALRELLDPDRAVLSIGSGRGEHEVPLHLAGYDIVASEVVDGALDDAVRLFPGFRAIHFDVLEPAIEDAYDDLLATGIDYALDDAQLRTLFATARTVTRPGGRVILAHRFRDNRAIRAIDRLGVPAWAATRNAYHRVRGDGVRVVRREHGWRRTGAEVRTLAADCGFRPGRVRHAAYAMELARLPMPGWAMRAAVRADRRLRVFNSATVYEFLPVA